MADGAIAGRAVADGALTDDAADSGSNVEAPVEDTPSVPLEVFETHHRNFLRGQLRRVTAQRMARSWVEAPKVDLFADVDLTRAEAHRAALKTRGQAPPSYNVYIAHAVVKAFLDLPEYNFQYIGGKSVPVEGIHVGMAVALGDNLVTVSMKHLEQAGLLEIQKRFKVLIRKALRSSLTRDELYRSSLTITNLGEFDVTAFTALINPPEAFILAIGKVEQRPVVRDGEVVPAVMCTFCLSFDHRAVDGAPASRLLQRIKAHMESEPGPP
jgi:pyruvate dehydrogenase E2 component (dihydrolipoamide acetyltransferase)